jgi:hypothetical protein
MNKYVVTIERVIKETHEMELEADSIMEAFDEARLLAESRNKNSKHKSYVTKIKEKESK